MATVNQVQALYISYFGRPADSQGLKYWTEDVGASAPLEQIANGFAATEEYLASIQGETVQEIITDFYENLIGRAPEAAGLDFWVQEVLSGRTTTQLVGLRITQAVDAFPADNTDKIAAESKFVAANAWTTTSGSTQAGIDAYTGQIGEQAGRDFLEPVTSVATIPDAAATTAAVNSLIAANPTGQELSLTALVDIADRLGYTQLTQGGTIISTSNFKLDGDSQSVNATNATLQAADNLSDSSTTDQDVLNISATAPTAAANVANIETVNFNITGNAGLLNAGALGAAGFMNGGPGDNVAAQAANFIGVKTFNVAGAVGGNGAGFELGLSALNTGATTINTSGVTGAASRTMVVLADNLDTTMTGGAISETYIGGTGVDTINLAAGNNVFSNAGSGADVVTHDTDASTVAIQVAGTGVVTLTATEDGAASVSADGVNTTVNASTSTATVNLQGGSGADTLTGGSAADILSSGTGAGQDTLTGGAGADLMISADANRTNFDYGNDIEEISDQTGITRATADVIEGFTANADRIQTGLAAAGGNSEIKAQATITFAAALADAQAWFLANNNDTYYYQEGANNTESFLFIDDGVTAGVDAAIVLDGAVTITTANIIA